MIKTKTVFSRKEAKNWYHREMRILTYIKLLDAAEEFDGFLGERMKQMLKNFLHKHISLEELIFEFEAMGFELIVESPLLDVDYNKKHKYYIISYDTKEGFYCIKHMLRG